MSVLTLEKKHHKWFLRFSFEEEVNLKDNKDTILAINLGINTDATCSVMKKDGTILARYFIRELEKSTPVKKWSLIQAKVPECAKRTQCTYNTFVEILKVA